MNLDSTDPSVIQATAWSLEEAHAHLGAALLGKGLGLGADSDDAAEAGERWFNRRIDLIRQSVCSSRVRTAVGNDAADDLAILATALMNDNFGSLPLALAAAAVVMRRSLDVVCGAQTSA